MMFLKATDIVAQSFDVNLNEKQTKTTKKNLKKKQIFSNLMLATFHGAS